MVLKGLGHGAGIIDFVLTREDLMTHGTMMGCMGE